LSKTGGTSPCDKEISCAGAFCYSKLLGSWYFHGSRNRNKSYHFHLMARSEVPLMGFNMTRPWITMQEQTVRSPLPPNEMSQTYIQNTVTWI
jgi:hypothetical protein